MAEDDTMPHRGSVQAQGGDVTAAGHTRSRSWAQGAALPKAEGHAKLTEVRDECHKNEVKRRKGAWRRAERFIETGPHEVVTTPIAKRYRPDSPCDVYGWAVRVDVDVYSGKAFTNPTDESQDG